MMIYIYAIINVAKCNYLTPAPDDSISNLATSCIVTWFRIELCVWFGIIFSNIIYMLFRSMIKPKIDHSIYLDENKKLPSIDTMLALQSAGTMFHNEFVPAFVSSVLYWS